MAAVEGPASKLVPHRGPNSSAPTTHTELDMQVAKAIYEMQSLRGDKDKEALATDLRQLQIYGAREVDLQGGRSAILVSVPVPQLKAWRSIQIKATRELEKKFGGEKPVVFVAFRRIVAKPKHGVRRTVANARPRSRTLTAVHEAWLEDMLYPTEIIGKRIRVKTDGKRLVKVLLDPKDQANLEGRVDVFSSVYKRLTGKDVVFEFPVVA